MRDYTGMKQKQKLPISCAADVLLCFQICIKPFFSHNVSHIDIYYIMSFYIQ